MNNYETPFRLVNVKRRKADDGGGEGGALTFHAR